MVVCSRDNLRNEAADAVHDVSPVDLAHRVAFLDPPGLSGRLRPGHVLFKTRLIFGSSSIYGSSALERCSFRRLSSRQLTFAWAKRSLSFSLAYCARPYAMGKFVR